MSDGAAGLAGRTAASVLDDLARRSFIIVSGKGGVGRTTVAAMIGLGLAARGKKVLVATTGRDDRLAWMLDQPALGDEVRRVDRNLSVQRLRAATCIREYGALVLRSSRLSSAVFDNGIVAPLMRAIPGLDDFALVGKSWHDAFRGGVFDTVIFDGPATGHLLYVLGVPRAIKRTIHAGPLTREAELMDSHFGDRSRTAAVLVGLPERWPLTELDELGVALERDVGIGVAAVVVNGVWPEGVEGASALAGDPSTAAMGDALARASAIADRQAAELAQWDHREGRAPTITLPWRFEGVSDRRALDALLAAAAWHDHGDPQSGARP